MNELIETAARLQALLESAGHRFCFIGGLAVQRWGEPRVTRDVDATVFVGFGNEEPVISLLLDHYGVRIDDAAAFALTSRIVLIQDEKSDAGIDVSLGGLDFERRAVDRSSLSAFMPDIDLRTCSAEDLLAFKAFAARELDRHDVKGILIRQQGQLDFDLIEEDLCPLVELKEEPAILDRWRELPARYEISE